MRFQDLTDSDARDEHTTAHVKNKLLGCYTSEDGFQGIDCVDIQPAIHRECRRCAIG